MLPVSTPTLSSLPSRITARLLYRTLLAVVAGLLAVTTTRRYTGLRSVPAKGGAIVVCNHISLADPLVLTHALAKAGRLPRSMAKASLFTAPVLGRIFTALGHIPVHRGTATAADALIGATTALENGELLVVYPEGHIPDHRTGDGWVGPLKTGVARLALTTGVPVIPTAQWGIQRVLPPHRRAPWLRTVRSFLTRPRVRVLVGEPLVLTGDPTSTADVRAASEQIRAAMNDLLTELRPTEAAAFVPAA